MHYIKYILSFLILFSCSTDECAVGRENLRAWLQDNGKLKVLCTTAMIADLVQSVGGEQVDVLTLIRGELNPHTYQLVKGDDEKLRFAQVLFANGLGLEHGSSLQYQLKENPHTVFLGDRIMEEESALMITLKGAIDPHIWMDASIWKKCVPFIAEALGRVDKNNAELYLQRGVELEARLNDLHEEMKRVLREVPQEKRFLVTSHDAFNYFTRSYLSTEEEEKKGGWQKRFAAPEGLSPDSQLSSSDIQHTVDFLLEHRIHVIFPESNVSRDSINKIVEASKEMGLDVSIADTYLYGDAMGCKGSTGESYEKMVMHNAKTIAHYLNGQGEKK